MIVVYILIAIVSISCIQFTYRGYRKDYLSIESTNAIKGIFILLVLVKHATPYITSANYHYDQWGDTLFLKVDSVVGQWIVALFLFYSGYGIMESIKNKGEKYISTIPKKRLLNVLVNFDVAVLFYILLIFFVNNREWLSWDIYLLSFIGWESIGNSNWYIFIILLAYAITYIVYKHKFFYQNKGIGVLFCNAILFTTMIILSHYKESWWYNTLLCYGAGLTFSIYKTQIEKLLKSHYFLVFAFSSILLILLWSHPFDFHGLRHNLLSIIISTITIILSMKICINNKVLIWLGKHLFPIYIYQRIPMIIFSTIGNGVLIRTSPLLYMISCIIFTLLIAHYYKYWRISIK